MLSRTFLWPQGYTSAAMISVNLDAEFYGRIFYPGIDVSEGDIQRLGWTGMQYGLPHLLDCFREHGVKGTFFIPGRVAELYPDAVRAIADAGHELGCHGYEHEILAHFTPEEQLELLKKAKAAIEKAAGRAVTGFRMPEGEITEQTLVAAKEAGFAYSSSLSNTDVPYIRQPAGLPELPISWTLFDLPYFTFAFDPPIPPGSARSAGMDQVLDNWLCELTGTRRWGALFSLQLDPQATGEQGRLFMLERVLDEIQKAGDVWLATGSELAAWTQKMQ